MKVCKVMALVLVLAGVLMGCAHDKVQGGFPEGHVLHQHQGEKNV